MENQTLEYARQLLLYLEKYLKQRPDTKDIEENLFLNFSQWLIDSNDEKHEIGEHSGTDMTDILIGMHMTNLANLMKKEQNRFVSETPFSSFMDFQFLFVLHEHGDMTKSQLISVNNMEMSSGIEVINRLKKFCWIEEKENLEDRRSKLIYVSNEGKIILHEYKTKGLNIYKSCSLKLDENEKSTVCRALELLNMKNE